MLIITIPQALIHPDPYPVGIHTTAATIWPGWSFGLWWGSNFEAARAATNHQDLMGIISWITIRMPWKLGGHQKSWKNNGNLFSSCWLGLETPKNPLPSPRSTWNALGTEDAASGTLFGSRRSLDPVTRERGTASIEAKEYKTHGIAGNMYPLSLVIKHLYHLISWRTEIFGRSVLKRHLEGDLKKELCRKWVRLVVSPSTWQLITNSNCTVGAATRMYWLITVLY